MARKISTRAKDWGCFQTPGMLLGHEKIMTRIWPRHPRTLLGELFGACAVPGRFIHVRLEAFCYWGTTSSASIRVKGQTPPSLTSGVRTQKDSHLWYASSVKGWGWKVDPGKLLNVICFCATLNAVLNKASMLKYVVKNHSITSGWKRPKNQVQTHVAGCSK